MAVSLVPVHTQEPVVQAAANAPTVIVEDFCLGNAQHPGSSGTEAGRMPRETELPKGTCIWRVAAALMAPGGVQSWLPPIILMIMMVMGQLQRLLGPNNSSEMVMLMPRSNTASLPTP